MTEATLGRCCHPVGIRTAQRPATGVSAFSTTSASFCRASARRAPARLWQFSRSIVEEIDRTNLGNKAGARSNHRFISIWRWRRGTGVRSLVGAEARRVYRTFLEDPLGALQCGRRVVRVRAIPARSGRSRDAVEGAYRGEVPHPRIGQVRAWIRDPQATWRHDGAQTPVNV